MRASLKLFVPVLLAVIAVSLLFSSYQVRRDRRIQERDLSRRAELLADSLEESVTPVLGSRQQLQRLVERFGSRESLAGIAVYDNRGHVLAVSSGLATRLASPPATVLRAIQKGAGTGGFVTLEGSPAYIYATPLERDHEAAGALAIVQDTAYIARQGTHLWRYLLFSIGVQVVLIALISFFMVRHSILAPVAKTAQWMRALRMGTTTVTAAGGGTELLNPLTREVATFAASLAAARASAENEAQLRAAGDSAWTAERLSVSLRSKLAESPLFVVANREP